TTKERGRGKRDAVCSSRGRRSYSPRLPHTASWVRAVTRNGVICLARFGSRKYGATDKANASRRYFSGSVRLRPEAVRSARARAILGSAICAAKRRSHSDRHAARAGAQIVLGTQVIVMRPGAAVQHGHGRPVARAAGEQTHTVELDGRRDRLRRFGRIHGHSSYTLREGLTARDEAAALPASVLSARAAAAARTAGRRDCLPHGRRDRDGGRLPALGRGAAAPGGPDRPAAHGAGAVYAVFA